MLRPARRRPRRHVPGRRVLPRRARRPTAGSKAARSLSRAAATRRYRYWASKPGWWASRTATPRWLSRGSRVTVPVGGQADAGGFTVGVRAGDRPGGRRPRPTVTGHLREDQVRPSRDRASTADAERLGWWSVPAGGRPRWAGCPRLRAGPSPAVRPVRPRHGRRWGPLPEVESPRVEQRRPVEQDTPPPPRSCRPPSVPAGDGAEVQSERLCEVHPVGGVAQRPSGPCGAVLLDGLRLHGPVPDLEGRAFVRPPVVEMREPLHGRGDEPAPQSRSARCRRSSTPGSSQTSSSRKTAAGAAALDSRNERCSAIPRRGRCRHSSTLCPAFAVP